MWAFNTPVTSLRYFSNRKFCSIIYLTRKPTVSKRGPKNLQNARSQIPTFVSHRSFISFLSGFIIMSLLSTFPEKYLNNISIWCCGNFNICYYTYNIYMTFSFIIYYHCYLCLIPAVKYICKYKIILFYFHVRKSGVSQLMWPLSIICMRGHMRKSMLGVWQGCLIY